MGACIRVVQSGHPPPVWRTCLLGEHHLDKLLVVDVALGVLLAVDEALHLLFCHLLAQGGQHVPELGRRDETVAVLVKVPQSLDEVLHSVADLLLGDGLQDGEECLEGDAALSLWFCTRRRTSASVGFWPRARSTSPT